MSFPVLEHIAKSARHTTFYLACGAEDATPIVFLHGWPELSISWRAPAASVCRPRLSRIAPDMRGYGRSSVYPRHEDYALEADRRRYDRACSMRSARDKAVWVGHDWGSAGRLDDRQHHPAALPRCCQSCVPYIPEGSPVTSFRLSTARSIPKISFPPASGTTCCSIEENFAAAQRRLRGRCRAPP